MGGGEEERRKNCQLTDGQTPATVSETGKAEMNELQTLKLDT